MQHPAASPAIDASVTVRGTYDVLAALGRTEEHALHAVRTGRGAFWLDLGNVRAPGAGATIEVTGQRVAPRTIAVSSIRVITQARMAASAPRTSTVLVLRAHWSARTPAKPTTRQARSIWLTKSSAWFKEVSHGRYSTTGRVTPWLKIGRPARCVGGAYTSLARALAKAKALGYQLNRYSRFILYLPCKERGIVGLGSMQGSEVWQFGSLDYDIALHEAGHNLGLVHANTRECKRGGTQVTWSGNCQIHEYADRFDVMGSRGDAHYQAFSKERLGWLQAMSTLTRSATLTLRPHETTGGGLKAIRVRVSRARSYWLEYRTKSGVDAKLPPGSFGLQIRVRSRSGKGEPQLLDSMPGSGDAVIGGASVGEWDQVRLLPGSGWTSPEGVRITLLSQTAGAAKVAVRFGAGSPRIPSSPSSVTATVDGATAEVSWARPADNGAIITRYVVTASAGGGTKTVTTIGGLVTRTSFTGLDPDTSYTFGVQAYNAAGASTARLSNPVTPIEAAASPTVSVRGSGR